MTKLQKDPKNVRLHPDDNKSIIRRSLEEIGGFRSIAVDGDDIVRAGNGVYEQATALGMNVRIVDAEPNELIAVRRADLKGDAAVRAALYDNAASDKSKFDAVVLEDIVNHERHLLDGILSDSDLTRILATQDVRTTDLVDLGYDHETSAGFSEGPQFKDMKLYQVMIEVPADMFESEHFKSELERFTNENGLTFKARMV